LARQAMTVTRLLDNNPREINESDARKIFERAYWWWWILSKII